MAPCQPHKSRHFAADMARGGGADAFGCADGLKWGFFSSRKKYCHNGGMAFPLQFAASSPLGSEIAIVSPPRSSEGSTSRENAGGPPSALFGTAIGSSG